MTRALLTACLSAVACAMAGWSHPAKISVIDEFCQATRNEFVEAVPQYFAGPDPWVQLGVQLDRLPDSVAGLAVAAVYYEGSQVKWVVLEMQGPGNAWFETTHYFFDENGLVKKRERHLDHFVSHIRIQEDVYFKDRKVIKTNYRHAVFFEADPAPGAPGEKEDWETFYDPNAPYYTVTSDLPALFLNPEFSQLAGTDGGRK